MFFSDWLNKISSLSLAFSSLTFLTTIWGQGVVFVWLIKTIGISALITWTGIGVISLRFRQAYKAQGLSLSDLPYQQPLYPLLPIGVIVLGTLMTIAVGYESVKEQPFNPRVSTMLLKICLKLTH
jgi:amino acid permease